MKFSKSKIVAIFISIGYFVILNIFSFKIIPYKYDGTYEAGAIGPFGFIIIGLICILISPNKTNFNVSEALWKEEFFWLFVKIFGWISLVLLVPIELLFLYKGQ
jgi:hypothetical protein